MTDDISALEHLHLSAVASLERAYDLNEVLSTFWLYAIPLGQLECGVAFGGLSEVAVSDVMTALQSVDRESFAKDGFYSDDLVKIAEIISRLDQIGLTRTSEALSLFLSIADEVSSNPPETSWCEDALTALTCPNCLQEARYRVWKVIVTALRPDLRDDARAGRLHNEARCYACNTLIEKYPFFYCDASRDEFLLFWPNGDLNAAENAATTCRKLLEQIPLQLRDGKNRIYIITGMPVAVFQEPDVAAITLCSPSEFDQVVNDEVLFHVESANLAPLDDYFEGRDLSVKKEWVDAAAAFARSFLKDPARPSFLNNIADCLHNIGHDAEADQIVAESERLTRVLLEKRVITRMLRKSQGSPNTRGDALHLEIMSVGLPESWGFLPLISKLESIAERRLD